MSVPLSKVDAPTSAEIMNRVLGWMKEDRPCLLLLTSVRSRGIKDVATTSVDKVAMDTLRAITVGGGVLDEMLEDFCVERSFKYSRVAFDVVTHRSLMEAFSVRYLPQIRLVRQGRTLLRSAVFQRTDGKFLAKDVAGQSFVRPPDGNVELVNVLDHSTKRYL